MDTNPGPQPPMPNQDQPVVAPPPSPMPQPTPQPPQPMPMQAPMMPQPPMSPAPKKSMLWLWITIAAIAIIVIGLVVGFFVVKAQADTTADEYTAHAKSYLGDVYDAASGSADDPAAIKNDIEDIEAPKLKETFMSGASEKYTDAEELSKSVKSSVSDLTDKISSYADFYEYYQKNIEINKSMSSLGSSSITASNAASFLKQAGEKLDEYKKLIEDTTFPDEIADKKDAFVAAAGVCAASWHDMEAAFTAGNKAQYTAGYNSYTDCLAPLHTAAQPFSDFYKSLGSKVKSAGGDIQDLRDSIKSDS